MACGRLRKLYPSTTGMNLAAASQSPQESSQLWIPFEDQPIMITPEKCCAISASAAASTRPEFYPNAVRTTSTSRRASTLDDDFRVEDMIEISKATTKNFRRLVNKDLRCHPPKTMDPELSPIARMPLLNEDRLQATRISDLYVGLPDADAEKPEQVVEQLIDRGGNDGKRIGQGR